jgi:hypothetical protein
MSKAFCSIAKISFRTLSKQDSPIQPEQHPCGYTYLAKKKAQGLKAQILVDHPGINVHLCDALH